MVGTMMERSHTALSIWFWAAPIWWPVRHRACRRYSSSDNSACLVTKPPSASCTSSGWHGATHQDRIGGKADGHVEVDEVYVGGKTRGEGRGVHHKALVVAAVEVRHREPGTAQDKRKDGRYAGRLRLDIAADRSAKSLGGFVESAVMPGSLIVTDDWSG